jgi:quercetin dioxygenase-like cupin family protein
LSSSWRKNRRSISLCESSPKASDDVPSSTQSFGAAVAVMKLIQDRSEKRMMQHCETSFTNTMRAVLKGLGNATMASIKGIPPCDIITFDVRFKSGEQICVPLVLDRWIQYLPSMKVMMTRHTAHETEVLMDVADPAFLPWHSHSEAEVVHVIRGRMIDLATNRVYGPGECWEIPAEVFHRAQFDAGTLCRVVCRPPLLDSTRRPIQMEEIQNAFQYEESV